jgi:hypothetical protein
MNVPDPVAGGKAKAPRRFRAAVRLLLAAVCFPLLVILFIWWLLRARWGLGLRRRSEFRVLPSMDFSNMFNEGTPTVLTGCATEWRAFKDWTPEYLATTLGNQEVEVLVTSGNIMNSYIANDFKVLQFSELIDIIFRKAPSGNLYYMLGKGFGLLRHLRQDLPMPILTDGRTLDESGTGLWIGHKGNLTSLHYDGWHGCLVQLRGKKQVTLYSPDETCNLYQDSPFGMRPYTTTIPSHSKDADSSQFPNVRRARPIEWVLEPGQLLYVPPYWWHEVESLENSISFHVRYLPRRMELGWLLLSTGNLFSMVWFRLVRRPLKYLLDS